MAAFDDIALYLHIFIGELRRFCIVGIDAPDFGCCQYHNIRTFIFEETAYVCLIGQIQFPVGSAHDIGIALFL